MTKEEWQDLALARGHELDGMREQCQRDYQLATDWKARAAELEVELGVRTTQYETAQRDVAHERQMRAIMAHTIAKCESEVTHLRAEVERLREESREGWSKAGWNAGGEVLLESRLAAATELLDTCRRELETDPHAEEYYAATIAKLRDHLAAQPAAPAQPAAHVVCPWLSNGDPCPNHETTCAPAAPARYGIFSVRHGARSKNYPGWYTTVEAAEAVIGSNLTGEMAREHRACWEIRRLDVAPARTEAEQAVLDAMAFLHPDDIASEIRNSTCTHLHWALKAELARRETAK